MILGLKMVRVFSDGLSRTENATEIVFGARVNWILENGWCLTLARGREGAD